MLRAATDSVDVDLGRVIRVHGEQVDAQVVPFVAQFIQEALDRGRLGFGRFDQHERVVPLDARSHPFMRATDELSIPYPPRHTGDTMFGMGGAKPRTTTEKKAAGTKTTPAKKRALVNVTLQLDPAQRDKLELLGGEAWLREQIDRAPSPSPADE
jgi:hypothetical protein